MLFTYALSKLAGVQFTLPPDIARRAIGSLSGYQLTWYYYGYSHVYASILGLTQLAGGSMLLFRKTALLGAAVMTPVMVNILMINLFFHIAVAAVCAAAFIFVSIMALLWRERGALLGLFWSRQNAEPAVPGRSKARPLYWAVLLVAIVVAQTVFGVLYSLR